MSALGEFEQLEATAAVGINAVARIAVPMTLRLCNMVKEPRRQIAILDRLITRCPTIRGTACFSSYLYGLAGQKNTAL